MKKILNLKILIYIIIQFIFVLFFKECFLIAYLIDNVIFNEVIVETCTAILQIYNIHGGQKYIISQYPIEIFIIYNNSISLKNDFSLLNYILKDQFKSIIITERPEIFNVWSPQHLDKKSDFLRGETFSGNVIFNKQKLFFTFYYSIQDADGYNLQKKDKHWPFLFDLIQQYKENNKKNNFNFQYNNIQNLVHSSKMEIILKQKSLKIKKGYITPRNIFKEDLINFYNEIYTSKPSIFMMFEKKTKFQLLIIELQSSNYYIDLLKSDKNINNLIKNKDKFYTQEWIKFVKNWLYKFEKFFIQK